MSGRNRSPGRRFRFVLRAAFGLALLAWWAPLLATAAGALVLGRVRFRLALGLDRALMAVGMVDAGRWVFAAEGARAERRMRAIRRRRRW